MKRATEIRKAHDFMRHLMKIVEENAADDGDDEPNRARITAAAGLVDMEILAIACGCAEGMAGMIRKLVTIRIEELI